MRRTWRIALYLYLAVRAPGAWAQTDEIQVYDAEITAPGHFNLTWHNNFTPSGRREAQVPGGIVANHTLNGVPEWAYGVTDWFEAGTYLPVYSYTGDGRLLFDGIKLRALFVVPHAHERTIFYGLNFELSYNKAYWETSRYSGEIRPIIGTHLGRFDLILNPILDTQFNGFGKLDFAPAVRIAYNLSGGLAVALENYSDFGPVEHFDSRSDQAQTLFAMLDYNAGADGVELGVGHGMTGASDSVVLKLMWIHDF